MKKLTYILLVIVFFNCYFLTLYYLKIFDNLGIRELYFLNIGFSVGSYVYLLIYSRFFIYKFNFLLVSVVGFVLGIIVSMLFKIITIEEFLFLTTFVSISICFLSYSVYFEVKKELVFK